MNKIEEIINKLNNKTSTPEKQYKWRCSVFPKNAKNVAKIIKEDDKAQLTTKVLFESSIIEKNPLTGKKETSVGKRIMGDDLQQINLFTSDELVEAFEELYLEMVNSRKDKRINSTKQSMFLESLDSDSGKVEESAIELSIPAAISDYTQADKDFFNWWMRDSNNNIYMKLKDGSSYPVPYVEGQETRIAPSNDFWTLFFKEHREDIKNWDSIINSKGWEIFEKNEDIKDKNIYQVFHEYIPRAFLNAVMLVATKVSYEVEDEDGKKIRSSHLENIYMAAKLGSKDYVVASEANLRKQLSYTMADLDLSEIPMMVRMTNEFGLAMYKIPYSLWKTDKKVEMPEIWKDFLENKFQIDKKDQYYRLANFMTSIVDANNFSRQALVIAGEGNDGKSVFTETISGFFNEYTKKMFAGVCGPNGMKSDNTQNGLINVIDCRLIVVPDVKNISEVINDDIFKNITGQDSIQVQKKYANPIQKNMAGTKLILTTNDKVYLPNTFATTRVIPLYFSPRTDGSDWDVVELKKKLKETMPDFLKWCYCYSHFINEKNNVPANKTKIFCQEDSEKTEKQCFECLYNKEQKFFYMTKDEYAQDDADYFGDFFDENFAVNPDGFVTNNELFDAWTVFSNKNNLDKVYTIQAKSKDAKALKKFISGKSPMIEIKAVKKTNDRTERGISGIELINKPGSNSLKRETSISNDLI